VERQKGEKEHMNQNQYFQIGAKLIGLYYLVMAMISIVSILPAFFAVPRARGTFYGIKFSYVPLLIVPVLLAVVALFLIRGSSFARYVELESGSSQTSAKMAEFFTVGAKLYGIYLIIGNLQNFARVLSNYLWLISDPSPYSSRGLAAEATGIGTNFFPQLVSIMFGILLLLRGELLTRWALPTNNETKEVGA